MAENGVGLMWGVGCVFIIGSHSLVQIPTGETDTEVSGPTIKSLHSRLFYYTCHTCTSSLLAGDGASYSHRLPCYA